MHALRPAHVNSSVTWSHGGPVPGDNVGLEFEGFYFGDANSTRFCTPSGVIRFDLWVVEAVGVSFRVVKSLQIFCWDVQPAAVLVSRERERERQRKEESERERERESARERETEKGRESERERERVRVSENEREKESERESGTKRGRETASKRDRKSERERERQGERAR
jgi:hypothetical protein